MMASAYIDYLTRAVKAMHGCECSHEGTSHVHETMDGATVWEGAVETFALIGHAKADKAFAWGYKDADGEIRYLAVLNVPPILTPREAVQVAIASRKQQ